MTYRILSSAFVAYATVAFTAVTSVAPAQAQPEEREAPRYLAAMKAEFDALRITHVCEVETSARARCSFRQRGAQSQQEFEIQLVYSDENDTVYFYISRYLFLAADGEHTDRVLRRLMEVNWELLIGKFEWDSADGEVRLSMTMNTDSNFDRRTFRSMVRSIARVADHYYGPLSRLIPSETE
ncbi:MAG: YbjN domain-containing protein [Myxococcota bacterium]